MVTLGNATSAAVQQSIANLGTNILQIYPSGGLRRGGGGSRPPNFKPADVTAIGQQVAGVTGVAPQAQTNAPVIRDGHNWSTTTFISEERRVGHECVCKCISWWSPYN